jgi:hypothetical protein
MSYKTENCTKAVVETYPTWYNIIKWEELVLIKKMEETGRSDIYQGKIIVPQPKPIDSVRVEIIKQKITSDDIQEILVHLHCMFAKYDLISLCTNPLEQLVIVTLFSKEEKDALVSTTGDIELQDVLVDVTGVARRAIFAYVTRVAKKHLTTYFGYVEWKHLGEFELVDTTEKSLIYHAKLKHFQGNDTSIKVHVEIYRTQLVNKETAIDVIRSMNPQPAEYAKLGICINHKCRLVVVSALLFLQAKEEDDKEALTKKEKEKAIAVATLEAQIATAETRQNLMEQTIAEQTRTITRLQTEQALMEDKIDEQASTIELLKNVIHSFNQLVCAAAATTAASSSK